MSAMQNQDPISAIAFDFGGVLLDWNPRYLYRKIFPDDPEAMERFFTEVQFNEWNLQQDAGRPFAEAVEDWCQRYPRYCDQIRSYDSRWDESLAGEIQPTIEILRSLKQANFPIYGFSNWSAEKFYQVRHKYEFLGWLEAIILSGEVKINKPDPRIFDVLLKRIGQPAWQCLLIDDSANNIAMARQLGLKGILYQSPEQLATELHQLGILNPTFLGS